MKLTVTGHSIVLQALIVPIAAGALQGQRPTGVELRLRTLLKPTTKESLQVTRDSDAVFFPTVAFYRGEVTRPGWHLRSRLAVVAVSGQDTVSATGLTDVPRLWASLSSSHAEENAFGPGVNALLGVTGFIGGDLRVISSQSDLSPAFKAFLDPQGNVDSIAAPTTHMDNGVRVYTSCVRTDWGVFRVNTRKKADGSITVGVDTIAVWRET